MQSRDDNDILNDFENKLLSHNAFNELVNKYKVRLYWHIRKIVINHEDTDDILQNTFIKIWKGLPTFQRESKLYTWIYRIATNETLTFLTNKKKRNSLSINDENADSVLNLKSQSYFEGDEAQKKLFKAIEILPDKQKIVFNMRYFEDMPYNQMSEILDTSESALKASYHFAVKKIEEFLKNN